MTNLREQVEQSIRERHLLKRRQRLLVGVSGGVDSMVLLRLLHELAQKQGWKLTVAHLNHHLRGRSSDADERLVRRTAKTLGLPVIVGHAQVKRISGEGKLSIEMAARKARHEFFATTARKYRISSLALAHHADDQVELFFLRLLRGAGTEALAGMKWRSQLPGSPAIQIVRPLLGQTKEDLLDFAAEYRIRHREDASNASLDFTRNRIRHELLPLLANRYQPRLRETILRQMELIGAESELLGQWAEDWMRSHGISGKSTRRTRNQRPVLRVPFDNLPPALQRRVVHQQLVSLGVTPEFALIERLRLDCETAVAVGLAERNRKPGARAKAGSAIRRELSGKIVPAKISSMDFQNAKQKIKLQEKPGGASFDKVAFRWAVERRNGMSGLKHGSGKEFFDADLVGNSVMLRHWQPGDRFQPIGMDRAVKLQDLFVNQKVPAELRRSLVLATTATNDIFWVEGLRISDRFKLTDKTSRRLRWQWKRG